MGHGIFQVCIEWCFQHSEKIGGPGKVVEIDESKIGRRKYQRGRIIEGQWIFGGLERESKKIFLVPVPNRTAETLEQLVCQWIEPGTTIMSDCWRGYYNLSRRGFRHFSVNHKYNFVDPDTGKCYENLLSRNVL